MNNRHQSTPQGQWSSFPNYLIVTIGAVVGLGNIFQFPFYVAKFGGLFVLFYILCELFISLPILLAELLIGRRGKQNPVGSLGVLALENGASLRWSYVGWICFAILFLTLSFYTVAVAFPLEYLFNIIKVIYADGGHANITHAAPTSLIDRFYTLEICFVVFLIATMLVIARGINRGLENISRLTVPLYFIIFLGLAIYSCTRGHFMESVHYLFNLRSDQSSLTILFAALTFAFFKLNVGMGSMIVYGSYLPYNVPIGKSTFMIACFDAIISLLVYFIIYPLSPASQHIMTASTQYYHNTLNLFASVENGHTLALLFFFAAIIAAWTPTIAIAESATMTLIQRFNVSRHTAVWLIGISAFIVGTVVTRSYNFWADWIVLQHWNFKELITGITANILTPFSAFLIALFAGWIVKRQITESELNFRSSLYRLWLFLIRVIAPIAIAGICLILL